MEGGTFQQRMQYDSEFVPENSMCSCRVCSMSKAWPRAKAQWCCEHKNVGCGSLPPRYDCTEDVAHWEAHLFTVMDANTPTVVPRGLAAWEARVLPDARRAMPESLPPAMTAMTAMSPGCDSVKVGCPKPIQPWIAQLLTPSAQHDFQGQALGASCMSHVLNYLLVCGACWLSMAQSCW